MDIGKSFTFMFDDERWITKILVGGLFILACMFLVGIPFVVGYMLRTTRNVMNGVEKPLPEWDNLGEMFKEGLILCLIYFVWLIPVWIVSCLMTIVAAAAGNSYDAQGIVGVLSICTSCISLVWWIVIALVTPAVFIRFAKTPEFASGFAFSALWEFTRDNIGNVIIAVLIGWVAALISSVGLVLCVIGMIFTSFWAYLVQVHLYGQIYAKRKGGGPQEPVAQLDIPAAPVA
jgi:hypothetical protein